MTEGRRNALWKTKEDGEGNVLGHEVDMMCAVCDVPAHFEGGTRIETRDSAESSGWAYIEGFWHCEAHTGKPGAGIRRY